MRVISQFLCRLVLVLACVSGQSAWAKGYLTLDHETNTLTTPLTLSAQTDLLQPNPNTAFIMTGTFKSQSEHPRHLAVLAGKIEFSGKLHDGSIFTAGDINLLPPTHSDGELRLIGGTVQVAGVYTRRLEVIGGSVLIDAEIADKLNIVAKTIEFGPHAKISGGITYTSPNAPVISPLAKLVTPPQLASQQPAAKQKNLNQIKNFYGVLFILSLALLAGLWAGLFPGVSRAHHRALIQSPGKCLALGVATLFVLPVISLFAMGTVIGMSIGMLLILVFILLNTLGFVSMGFTLGSELVKICQRPEILDHIWGRPIAAAMGITILVVMAFFVKYGIVISLVAGLFGLGALVQCLWTSYSQSSELAKA